MRPVTRLVCGRISPRGDYCASTSQSVVTFQSDLSYDATQAAIGTQN